MLGDIQKWWNCFTESQKENFSIFHLKFSRFSCWMNAYTRFYLSYNHYRISYIRFQCKICLFILPSLPLPSSLTPLPARTEHLLLFRFFFFFKLFARICFFLKAVNIWKYYYSFTCICCCWCCFYFFFALSIPTMQPLWHIFHFSAPKRLKNLCEI